MAFIGEEDKPTLGFEGISRAQKTEHITVSLGGYWRKKNYSSHFEIGVKAWGSRRADVISLNTKLDIVICEVKSCWEDFQSDKKWRNYLTHCNRMYFAFDKDTWDKYEDKLRESIDKGVGIIFVSHAGVCHVVRNAKTHKMKGKKELITSLAWKSGYSKATVKQFHRPKL